MSRFTTAVAALGASGLLALGGGHALAGDASFESRVKILDDASGAPPEMRRNYYPHFTGTVRSAKDACERSRLVKLFLKPPSGDPILKGKDETNQNGSWEIAIVKPNENDFFAVARPRDLANAHCKGDRSPIFHHNPF